MTPQDHVSAAQPSYGSPDETSGAMYLPAPTCDAGTSAPGLLEMNECEKSHSLILG